jgi:hypothetical protein
VPEGFRPVRRRPLCHQWKGDSQGDFGPIERVHRGGFFPALFHSRTKHGQLAEFAWEKYSKWLKWNTGRLAQRLEHPVYTRKVVRSNRTSPTICGTHRGDVVQLVRTLPCHGRGREFESRRPRHKILK